MNYLYSQRTHMTNGDLLTSLYVISLSWNGANVTPFSTSMAETIFDHGIASNEVPILFK